MSETTSSNVSIEKVDRVFTVKQIAIASLIASPVAGCVLMAANYLTWGHGKKAQDIVLYSVVAVGAILVFGTKYLPNVPGLIYGVVYAVGMWHIAKHLQGKLIDACLAYGGEVHKHWVAVVSAICAGLLLVIIPVFITAHFYPGIFAVAS